MPGTGLLRGSIAIVAAACALALAAPAAATTICVPSFTAACPEGGGNVKLTDVEEAMSYLGKDGNADEVRIAPGVFTENNEFEPEVGFSSPESFEPLGTDPLTIVGAGPGSTILTGTGTKNVYLFNLGYNNSRLITIRDLTVRIPASFEDGAGSGFQLDGDVLENVDIVSLNKESDAISSAIGSGNVFRDGEIRGEGAQGSIDNGIAAGSASGSLLAEDAKIVGASWALVVSGAGAELTARRVDEVDTRTYGAVATGGTLWLENSRMTIDDGFGLFASAAADDTSLNADHVTILNSGSSYPATEAKKFSPSAGDAAIAVSNSILRGFGSGYKTETPFGPGVVTVSIKARYSNLLSNGSNSNGIIDFSTGNIDADPLLNPDLSLPPGSPSIDAGDPAAGGLPVDYLGAPRPVDGNGDGVAVRDQGAFEYQPPAGPPDTTPPQTTIVKGPGKRVAKGIAKFRFRSSESGSTLQCKLDRRKVARCRSPKTYKHLKPGRHTFKAWATDAAGNKDPTPAKRRFRVPKP